MIVMSVEEFAAKRTKDQEALEKVLEPVVKAWLEDEETHLPDLLDEIKSAFADVYEAAGGTKKPLPSLFVRQAKAALAKGGEPDEHSVERISLWLATGILNAATVQASKHDPDDIELTWVTMGDSAVRDTHEAAEGQSRAPDEFYDVGGHRMRYPGDPSAPIELWINCRCSLAPSKAEAMVADAAEGDTVDPKDEKKTEPVMAMPVPWHGVLAPEGIKSGDGRMFAENSLTFRPLPLPLTWQKASSDGHGGSVTVAVITNIWRHGAEMRAEGHMLSTVEADEVIGLLAEFKRFGVSVDADDAEMEIDEENELINFTKARIASASIVSIPAFAEAWVALGPWDDAEDGDRPTEVTPAEEEVPADEALAAAGVTFGRGPGWLTNPEDTKRLHDYWTKPGEAGYEKIGWGVPGDFNRCRVEVGQEIAENSPEDVRFLNQICAQWHHDALGYWPAEHLSVEDAPTPTEEQAPKEKVGDALVAAVGHTAPSEWFADPEFTEVTPLTITDEGRVFGHVADWEGCHIGYGEMCMAPPHSSTGYAYFLTGYVHTDAGDIPTGPLTVGGGHADKRLGTRAAMAHYDDVSAAVADVTVGEDDHGIWCAGWIRPGATDEMVTALRASPLSGDWRKTAGSMEMIAAHAVNVQGFPIPRVQIAARNGEQVSLVAAGMVMPREPRPEFDVEALGKQIAAHVMATIKRKERVAALAARMNREGN